MSTLQSALAVFGSVFLLILLVYTLVTVRRATPRQADPGVQGATPSGALDTPPPGGSAERTEPAFEHSAAGKDVTAAALAAGDPLFGASADGDAAVPLPTPERKPALDPLVDVIAPLSLDHRVSGEAALAALPPTRRAGSKPFAIEGLNDRELQWETPVPGQRYRGFQAGVQLANRTGALNEIEFSEFVVKTQTFADTVNAAPDFPDMLQEVARARELDQFASEHDAQLTVSLRAVNAAWSPGYLQQNAVRLGFTAASLPGRMLLLPAVAGASPILGLAFDPLAAMSEDPTQSAIRELTLSLDVPQVPREERPFARLRETAAALAASMDGAVTDQQGQPLREEALDTIASDLEQLYDTLDARDLSAGSVLARRLFS